MKYTEEREREREARTLGRAWTKKTGIFITSNLFEMKIMAFLLYYQKMWL